MCGTYGTYIVYIHMYVVYMYVGMICIRTSPKTTINKLKATRSAPPSKKKSSNIDD